MGCGNSGMASFYFFSYSLLVSMIFLNMFIAIIMQGYEDTSSSQESVYN